MNYIKWKCYKLQISNNSDLCLPNENTVKCHIISKWAGKAHHTPSSHCDHTAEPLQSAKKSKATLLCQD